MICTYAYYCRIEYSGKRFMPKAIAAGMNLSTIIGLPVL
jgi:hypothetical protein